MKVWARWALAALIVALAAMPVVLRYLVFWPLDQWQVDVEVYRQAGESILTGRPIYLAMTEAPQLLPFTYPPFAAILSLPLALVPFGMAGWAWTLAQVLATTAITWYAARPVWQRPARTVAPGRPGRSRSCSSVCLLRCFCRSQAHHCMCWPPLIAMLAPVTNAASSEAR